jgi:RHS repeat-associated protein
MSARLYVALSHYSRRNSSSMCDCIRLRQRGLPLLLLTFFIFLIAPIFTNAQDLAGFEQGIKPYGSYEGGDIDSISMVNGGLSLHIPLISFPQRGGRLHLGVSVIYNNPIYTLLDNRVSGRCPIRCYTWEMGSASSSNPNTGAGLAVAFDLPGMTDVVTFPGGQGSCPLINNYKIVEQDGAVHLMSATNNGNWLSLDTTGYTYYSSAGVLQDRQGTQYTFNLVPYIAQGQNCGEYLPSTLARMQDVNGNNITSSGNYTDTMGRVIPQSGQSTTDYSHCTGSLTTTSAVIWSFPGPNGGTAQFKVCYAQFPINYTPTCSGYVQCYGLVGTNPQIQSIVLPSLTTWTFAFDTTGALSSITFPTGGTISYSPTPSPNYHCFPPATTTVALQANASVQTRTVNANDGTGAHQWQYQLSPMTGSSGGSQAIVTDPNGNDAVHTLTGLPTSQPKSCSLYETELDEYSGSHANPAGLLRKKVTNYSAGWGGSFLPYGQLAINVVPISITLTDVLSGKSSQVTRTWDSGIGLSNGSTAIYGDLLIQNDYDFAGTLLRTTNNAYMALNGPNSSSYLANNLLNLPYTVQIKDGSGNQTSLTQYNYDETTRTSSGLTSSYQFTSSPPSGNYRGNNTSLLRWLNTGTFTCPSGSSGGSNSYLISKKTYFDDGMLNTSTDPCGNTTTYAYNLTYWGALPTTVTNALSQNTTNTYDFNTSLLASTTDPNNLITNYNYDSMWRISEVDRPDGGKDVITHQETTVPFTATVSTDINSTLKKTETNVFDGLGRVSQKQLTSDPQGTVYTDTSYDALGRVATVSNPYRTGTDATTSTGTTTYGYDALSRKTSVTYPDNSVLRTAYCGPSTLVTDPTGKWRRSRVDALGRQVEVDEPNSTTATVASNGCPGTGEPIWVTSYSYNALGNLTGVVQNGSHNRTFTYDSLSKLLTAANPENGTITYTYNPDGSLLTKKDARGLTVCFGDWSSSTSTCTASTGYDALLRVRKTTYSNGDPTLTFTYDETGCLSLAACQNLGHRTSMTDGAGSEKWAYNVDKTNLRTIHREQRTNNSITKSTTYYLDLAGNVTKLIYPTGRTVNYTFDAADRPKSATDSANGISYAKGWKTKPANTACIAGGVCYTPQGSIYALSIGQTTTFTGFNVLESFNSRLQPSEIQASSTAGTVIDITYSFVDPSTSANAGHVYKITNNLASGRTQTFTYDQLNRVTSAGTTATTGNTCWGYQYSYDAWGNLLSQAGWTPTYNACTEVTMGVVTADASNHISAMAYDPSGNTLSDGNYSYTWDGESQLKTAGGVTYTYDGDGRRAAKVGSRLYWYGSGGEVLAETDASGNTQNEYVFFDKRRVALLPAGSNALYYAEDFLGTSRVIVQLDGTLCYDADFPPFGAERSYVSTCSQNYKFEGKERDTETQNDDFGAREYSWRFGRWLSSDWSFVPVPVPYANLSNPQTLNLYAMVADDPESFTDLDGHGSNGECYGFFSCLGNALLTDNVLGIGRQDPNNSSGTVGAAVGDFVATVQGAVETVVSAPVAVGGGALCATGVGCLVGAPAVAVGVAGTLQGSATASEGFGHLLSTALKSTDGASGASSEPVHGNDLGTTKPAEGYSLRDKDNGKVLKYGETTQNTKRYSKSYLEKHNAAMKFEAKGTKRQMHDWQHDRILEHKAQHGVRPPLNKSDY